MARYRESYRVGIADEVAFEDGAVAEFTAATEENFMPTSLDIANLCNEIIASKAQILNSGGAHVPFVGLTMARDGVKIGSYIEGMGTAAGDTIAPTRNAAVELWDACFQTTPVSLTGSKAEVGATTTVIVEDVETHNPGANCIGMAPFGRAASKTHIRPYTYVAATDTFNLLLSLPDAPALDDVIYGGWLLHWAHTWTAAGAPRSKGVKLRSASYYAPQQVYLRGVVATLEIPEHGPKDAVEAEYTLRASLCDLDDVLLPASVWASSEPLATVGAGGSCIIGKFGSAIDWQEVEAHRISIHLGGDYTPDESTNEASGITGWTRQTDAPTITLTIPLDQAAATALTATTYRQVFETGEIVHCQWSAGHASGRYAALYWPKAILTSWKRVDLDGLAFQQFVIAPVDGLLGAAVGSSHDLVGFVG